jgi:hypothetical protein
LVLEEIRSKLNRAPRALSVPLAVVILGSVIWYAVVRFDAIDNYAQPDIKLICTDCGYTTQLTVQQYADRSEEELPGGLALIQGPALTCPDCGRRCLERQQSADR